uniref:Protein kinase domain-containing protein n=1 Tax=Desertifilum tharense IPPAS B-1220 TaxID=1781255 RepID=A0ACD5H2M0_9CYAN
MDDDTFDSAGNSIKTKISNQTDPRSGGFGRTYLAIDLERFKEPCVLKELTVPYQDRALWEKAQILFQREASTLYQIQHAQIPRFWASFEDNHRLFLVQDFVRGKSYRHLLQARQRQGRHFSPNEVLHLLNQLLPVLSYIHERKIIHRDISPENIMLQLPGQNSNASASAEVPRLPVLIDFGAVKAAVTYLLRYAFIPFFNDLYWHRCLLQHRPAGSQIRHLPLLLQRGLPLPP